MQQKILLVDDREDNLLSVQTILEPAGYEFVKANSGKEALKVLLNQVDFALILMDVNMPSLNGFETASLIYEREKLKNIPIIFITAHGDDEKNIFKGYRTGAVDFITKPINPKLLRAKVAVFTDLYQKNQQLLIQEERLKAANKTLENEIKERKLSEKKVNELNRQLVDNINSLEAANKELDRFAFMASHDLQEPLRKIRTFCDMLTERHKENLHEEARGYITRIEKSASRMQTLIKDILTFSRLADETFEYHETDINHVIDEILTEFQPDIEEKKVLLDKKAIPPLWVKTSLMQPLFSNLINNAFKYRKADDLLHLKIWAETAILEKKQSNYGSDGKYCRIFIQDNGIGFEQKYGEQIFEMFKRLHNNKTYEGSGIGLALCKKIVEKHNGYISVRSEPGAGSTFIVTLPVKDLAEHDISKNQKAYNLNVVNK